jgi:hypothetical protein
VLRDNRDLGRRVPRSWARCSCVTSRELLCERSECMRSHLARRFVTSTTIYLLPAKQVGQKRRTHLQKLERRFCDNHLGHAPFSLLAGVDHRNQRRELQID